MDYWEADQKLVDFLGLKNRCHGCGEIHKFEFSHQKYCSQSCRQRAYKSRVWHGQTVTPKTPVDSDE